MPKTEFCLLPLLLLPLANSSDESTDSGGGGAGRGIMNCPSVLLGELKEQLSATLEMHCRGREREMAQKTDERKGERQGHCYARVEVETDILLLCNQSTRPLPGRNSQLATLLTLESLQEKHI